MHIIIIDCIVQPSTAPPNDTAILAASRRGNPSCSEQREENRADVDEHCGGASADVTFAPVESDHLQPEPEQPEPRILGQAARVGQPSLLSRHTTPR